MAVMIACPKCRATYSVSEAVIGKSVKCQNCQTAFAAKPQAAGANRPASAGQMATSAASTSRGPGQQELNRFGIDSPIAPPPNLFGTDNANPGIDPLANHVVQGLNFVPLDQKKLIAAQTAARPIENPYDKVKPPTTLQPKKSKKGLLAGGDDAASQNEIDPDDLYIAKAYTNLVRYFLLSTPGMLLAFAVAFIALLAVALIVPPGTEFPVYAAAAVMIVWGLFVLYYGVLALVGYFFLLGHFREEQFVLFILVFFFVPMGALIIGIVLFMDARARLHELGARFGWTGAWFK